MGVILAYANPTTVITDQGLKNIQRFTFVDMERILISVTLWGEMKEIMNPILEEAANTLSVVVAKRLSPSKSKFKLIELDELLVDQTITLSRNQLTQGSEKILTLAEIETAEKNGDYWVKGLLQIGAEEQNVFYLGCNNCSAKISTDQEGIEYLCYNCQNEATVTSRPLVLMIVADERMMVKVVEIDKVVERILQTTSANIFRLSQLRRLSEITLSADIYTSTSKKNLSMTESDDANESNNSKA
ncbi:hypothetical protein LIER_41117 [Lithospermum erythrorhizon]|uniref:Shieldin complex subunit 2 C-terminal domain-containing protein n=1 Tax=Lithospermum erythrorhizon TaxID=34254 RepID=A0AAV3R6I0_LITER